MGLLDDAIREHLELKRRHGADPSEVERQEHEALGPARRSAAAAAEADDDVGAVSATEFDDDGPERYEDDALGFDEEPPARAPVAVEEPEPPVARDDPDDRVAPDDRVDRAPAEEIVDDLEPVDEAELAPPPPAERVPVAEPEPDAEPESARREREPEPTAEDEDEDEGADEDVLEETPEFLQETPEHDRLWFEQKPPRDFEF
jgi:hypothetical protein